MSLKNHIDDLRKYRSLLLVIFVFCMMSTFSFLATSGMRSSSAASVQGFNAGNIISDAVMANYNSMSVADIQAFLKSKNKCNNTDYNYYLELKAKYPANDWHFENGHFVCLAEELFGDGTEIGTGQTAAEIIYQAAQDYHINPQVLLVLLEKEQSLITDTYPNAKQYRSATGYGCPDTAACDTKYYGFKNQVRNAAALFRDVLDRGYYAYPEKTTGVYIGYNPSSSCGRSEVYIENRATAALYRYTPYQPNAAALAAGYGTGDSCSAYGNRNFYLYFTDWFGSTQAGIEGTLTNIADGEYMIVSKLSDKRVLGYKGGNAELAEIADSKAVLWRFTRTANGAYTITNVATGQNLDLAAAETVNGANILVYAPNATCAQQWKIYTTNDGSLMFESTCATGMVLDVYAALSAAGTNIQLYIANNTNAQKWSLSAGRTLADGVYTIKNSAVPTQVIDLTAASLNNGANIQSYSGNKTIAQKWQLTYNLVGGYYSITDPLSGKSLDVEAADLRAGVNVQLYASNQTCAQRWQLTALAGGDYTIRPVCATTQALATKSAQPTSGDNIQLAAYDNTKANQRWQFEAAPKVADGIYTLVSKLTSKDQKVLDLSENKVIDGQNIQLWEYDPTINAQKWQFVYDAKTGYYNILNANTTKAIDLTAAVVANGTNINLYATNTTCAQRWRVLENGADTYTIFSTCNQLYALDVSGGSTANGTNIQLWSYDAGAAAQKWQFLKR